MQRRIFSAWMGPGPMSAARTEALLSLVRNSGCAQAHLTRETLADWVDAAFPLHPAFPLLSAVHQCDYLRCYVLHVHGGGYADVKPTHRNWRTCFDLLERSPAFGLGYTEVGPHGIATVGGELEAEMKRNYQRIIGVCAMIFRPRTDFTTLWYAQLQSLLDRHAEALRAHPARHPQDHLDAAFSDGSRSGYPLRWTEVGGDLFHPLAYRFADDIVHADLAPSFENYR